VERTQKEVVVWRKSVSVVEEREISRVTSPGSVVGSVSVVGFMDPSFFGHTIVLGFVVVIHVE
jgi:hypothetical protein